MDSFRLCGGETGEFNKKFLLRKLRDVDPRSLITLYLAKLFLFTGIVLVFLNNLNVLAPGSYFGALNWVTMVVFFIGNVINFIFIPLLYFSSLKNFKKENYFWDKETFWILPLFFFGTFFLYSANISLANTLLFLSIAVVAITHIRFFLEARKLVAHDFEDSFSGHEQYSVTLSYLSAYYILLIAILLVYNPLQHAFFWIRINM